ncbi:MAG: hypothetical protein U5K56_00230 [Halioglobus sp.]|nr:hypothetical protein [Halioglobus sp.]
MQGAGHHNLAWDAAGTKHARNASLVNNALKKVVNHLLKDGVDVVLSSEEFEYLKGSEAARALCEAAERENCALRQASG